MSHRLIVGALLASIASAQDPSAGVPLPVDYYASVDAGSPASLRASLHEVIDDHQRFPYSSRQTDTWDVLERADEDPADPARIVDLYANQSLIKHGRGNDDYNREHTWPKSYGFPKDGLDNSAYTDCHHLFLCNGRYNSARSNKPFRDCAGCEEFTTTATNGTGGGSGAYPGNSNWTRGRYSEGSWEVWGGRRGDVARALFYLDVRYEGGAHGTTGHPEPDLILCDDEALIEASRTGANEAVGYMGMRSVLLRWHREDPVTAADVRRNDVVFSYQGNRNPFVDHPEWVDVLFDPTWTPRPRGPQGLLAFAGESLVALAWDDVPGALGYDVLRSTEPGGPHQRVNTRPLEASDFVDFGLASGQTYFYVVVALEADGIVGPPSLEVSGTTGPRTPLERPSGAP